MDVHIMCFRERPYSLLADVLELAPHPSILQVSTWRKTQPKASQKWWKHVGQMTPVLRWQIQTDRDGPGEADQSTGCSQLSKAGLARELLGDAGAMRLEGGKRMENWGLTKTCGIPVGYLWDSCGIAVGLFVCHGLSSCKFGTTLCDNIQLGSSGVVGLHCQNSSLESGCVCSGFVVPLAPILMVSMGNGPLHACRTGLSTVFRHGGLRTNWKRATKK